MSRVDGPGPPADPVDLSEIQIDHRPGACPDTATVGGYSETLLEGHSQVVNGRKLAYINIKQAHKTVH